MTLDDYWNDFEQRFWKTGPPGFWKLERQQSFREPGDACFEAFAEGHWEDAMRILGDRGPEFADYYRRIAESGFCTRRVRVVEQPLTPYLQWELHVLKLRHDHGGLTRVVGPQAVEPAEAGGPVPEVYTLGTEVMYEALYNTDGVLAGARRWLDPTLIVRLQSYIAGLYEHGEPLDEYFARDVAPLEPPPGE